MDCQTGEYHCHCKVYTNINYSNSRYLDMTNCDLHMVGYEFSMKPYALAVQKGSYLKQQLDDA